MRTMLAAAALLLAGSAFQPALAMEYPWCARYGNSNGGTNCGFVSWQQCMMAISGNGGYCAENGFYRAAEPVRAKKPRRDR